MPYDALEGLKSPFPPRGGKARLYLVFCDKILSGGALRRNGEATPRLKPQGTLFKTLMFAQVFELLNLLPNRSFSQLY